MKRLASFLRLRRGHVDPAIIALLSTLGVVLCLVLVQGGAMFSPGELNARTPRGEGHGGAKSHAELVGNCSACHAPAWNGETMAGRCLKCHANVRDQIETGGPLHGKLSDAVGCIKCHTEHQGPHGLLTKEAVLRSFDHDCAAFRLTGAHRQADCRTCHETGLYRGTPTTCVSCHAEPALHLDKFGNACAACHTTTTWKISRAGSSPHPVFDHDLTGFPLSGKHEKIDCSVCHQADKPFKGTPRACVSCHAEPAVHKGRFGTQCADCHSTHTWDGAQFKHDIFSMAHRGCNNKCIVCHTEPNNLKSYTCYQCHEHARAREERRHARRFVADLDNCIACHGRGKRNGRP